MSRKKLHASLPRRFFPELCIDANGSTRKVKFVRYLRDQVNETVRMIISDPDPDARARPECEHSSYRDAAVVLYCMVVFCIFTQSISCRKTSHEMKIAIVSLECFHYARLSRLCVVCNREVNDLMWNAIIGWMFTSRILSLSLSPLLLQNLELISTRRQLIYYVLKRERIPQKIVMGKKRMILKDKWRQCSRNFYIQENERGEREV